MSIYMRTRAPSLIARMHAANVESDRRTADKADAGNQLKRKLRSALMALNNVEQHASREWHKANDPVPAPAGVGAMVHPQRARALAEFMALQGWSSDPRAPITATETEAEMCATASVQARAELAEAEAAFAEYERTKHDG